MSLQGRKESAGNFIFIIIMLIACFMILMFAPLRAHGQCLFSRFRKPVPVKEPLPPKVKPKSHLDLYALPKGNGRAVFNVKIKENRRFDLAITNSQGREVWNCALILRDGGGWRVMEPNIELEKGLYSMWVRQGEFWDRTRFSIRS